MLQKRRDIGSLPDGLGKAKTSLVRGMAVSRAINKTTGEVEISPAANDSAVYGFVTNVVTSNDKVAKEYDNINAGEYVLVYTSVKNNEWATDQFTGTLVVGDIVTVTNGKFGKNTTGAFEVTEVMPAMGGYVNPMITFKVL